jgi:hypothetical protein
MPCSGCILTPTTDEAQQEKLQAEQAGAEKAKQCKVKQCKHEQTGKMANLIAQQPMSNRTQDCGQVELAADSQNSLQTGLKGIKDHCQVWLALDEAVSLLVHIDCIL